MVFTAPFSNALRNYATRLRERSTHVAAFFNRRMDALIACWIAFMVLAGAAKVLTAPLPPATALAALALMLPYLAVALAPVAGYRITCGSFPRGLLSAQPAIRLARIGRWHDLGLLEARSSPAFGPAGFMASLLAGMLLNVPVRTLEYLSAVPAVGSNAPHWAQVLQWAMTADVVMMNFFYTVCFVLALRSVPLFPRMLLFAWVMDITLQFAIATHLAATPGLPASVADPLVVLLVGNVKKVLVSIALWLPYLLLSTRVNLTYRLRVPALA